MKKDKNVRKASISKSGIFSWSSFAVAAMLLVMVVGALVAFSFRGTDKSEMLKEVNGVVTIPMEEILDGKAHFYRFESGKKEVVFFAVKGSDGIVHTAFDACEVCCFTKKKGYIQQGDYMICLGCREKYAINMIDQVNGIGCRPYHLGHAETGRCITIRVAALKSGAYLF